MNGVLKPWDVFVEALVARETLPTWDRICDDFVQEETHSEGSCAAQCFY